MQFRWNIQLLTIYSLLRNLLCSLSNLSMVDEDRIFAALNIFVVSRTIVLAILNVFWRDRANYWPFSKKEQTTGLFILFIVRCFFLLIHLLVVEDYESPKSASHILSVPLTLNASEFYLDPCLSSPILIVSLMIYCVRLLSELIIMLSTHHVTNHLTCCNKL